MGQAPSQEEASPQSGAGANSTSATGANDISASDWSKQVLAEYSKLHGERVAAEESAPVHLSAAGVPLRPPNASGRRNTAHSDMMMFASERNGKDEAPSLVQHSSMDERLLSASMHEVQQMLGPAILSSQRASSGKDPRAVARDDYGSAPEDESDVVESGGEKPATGPLVDADWRPLLLKQQTSEETTTTVQLRSPNEAEGPGLRASTATDADGQLPQSRYGAASSGDSVTADTGASAADATSEQVGPDMLNETIPPRKRKRGLYANGDALEAGGAYEVGGNAGGAISATATTAEAHASHAPQNVALVRELSVEAVAERGGRQGVESRGVSRRNTRETTGSCGSYSELNLTMESALSALYDDSLPPLTTTAEHFGPSSVGPAPNSAHDPKYYAPPNAVPNPAAGPTYAPQLPHAYADHAPPADPYAAHGQYMPPCYAHPATHSTVAYAQLPHHPQPHAWPSQPEPHAVGSAIVHDPALAPHAYPPHAPLYPPYHAPRAPSLPASTSAKDGVEHTKGASDRFTRLTWSPEEDALIMTSVESLGPKWRKIAALLPNRSDDAVRSPERGSPSALLGGVPRHPHPPLLPPPRANRCAIGGIV